MPKKKTAKAQKSARAKSPATESSWEMAIGRDLNWQGGKNLPDSNFYMLVNQLNCDVTFRVGDAGDIIPAHKYMLTSRSSVFQEMFSESETFLEEGDDIIVEDIDPQTFRQMLIFMYTDDIRLDPDNVSLLLYAAKKYQIAALRSRCLQYLEADLSCDTACVIMEQAHVYGEDDLREKALKYIHKTGHGTLNASTFGELCHECLGMVIESDNLNAPEDVVFLGCLYWSECELKRQEQEITPEGRRDILGDAIYKIRFPQIEQKFFVQNVSPYGILNDVDTNTVLQYYVCPEMGAAPFKVQGRMGRFLRPDQYKEPILDTLPPTSGDWETPLTAIDLPPLEVNPDDQRDTDSTGKKGSGKRKGRKKKGPQLPDTNLIRFSTRDEILSWACDGQNDDAIGFACDHDFILKGLMLFGPSTFVRGDYLVRARVEDDKKQIMRGSMVTVEVDANPRDKYYQIYFKAPVFIEKLKLYTLIVNVRGEPSFQGSNGNHTVFLDNMTFRFFDSEDSTNGTNVQGGQIPGLIVNTD